MRRLPPRRAAAQIKQLMRSALVLMYACLGRVAGLTFKAAVRRRPHVLRAVATDADLAKALSAKSPFLREFAARGADRTVAARAAHAQQVASVVVDHLRR